MTKKAQQEKHINSIQSDIRLLSIQSNSSENSVENAVYWLTTLKECCQSPARK